MRLTVRKDRCPICAPSGCGWLVTDQRGHCVYFSWHWRQAVDYAFAVFKQPATGVQQVETNQQTHTRKALPQ